MATTMQQWKFYCGVNITLHDVLEQRAIRLGKNFYFTLPFLNLSGMLVQIKDKWYYATMPIAFTSEGLTHYHVAISEAGYRLQGNNCTFPLHEVNEDTFDNELNPIPEERRKERDAVMAKYTEPYKYPFALW